MKRIISILVAVSFTIIATSASNSFFAYFNKPNELVINQNVTDNDSKINKKERIITEYDAKRRIYKRGRMG